MLWLNLYKLLNWYDMSEKLLSQLLILSVNAWIILVSLLSQLFEDLSSSWVFSWFGSTTTVPPIEDGLFHVTEIRYNFASNETKPSLGWFVKHHNHKKPRLEDKMFEGSVVQDDWFRFCWRSLWNLLILFNGLDDLTWSLPKVTLDLEDLFRNVGKRSFLRV